MPRDSNGNYTLPLPDVEGGETISSVWANTTMADIAAAMTDSLSRTGQGGMSAPLPFDNGSVGAPSITFVNDTVSGIYLAAVGDVRMTVGPDDVMRWRAGSVQVWDGAAWDNILVDDDSTSVPVPAGSSADDWLSWSGSAWVAEAPTAVKVGYDNAASGLTAADVQAAIDEVDSQVDANTGDIATVKSDLDAEEATTAAHRADSTIHFTEGSIVHQNISGAGTNTHAQIDSHIGNAGIHFADSASATPQARNTSGWVNSVKVTNEAGAAQAQPTDLQALTQAEYDGLTPDANTLYYIVG